MPSVSSPNLIHERTFQFCADEKNWWIDDIHSEIFEKLNKFLQSEYALIPEKERIGKGAVYISKFVAKGIFEYLKDSERFTDESLIKFSELCFSFGESFHTYFMQHFAELFVSEFFAFQPQKIERIRSLVEKFANYEDWAIRESATIIILAGLKKNPEEVLNLLQEWARSNNDNIRRLVAESLKPKTEAKWLRDSTKNEKVLEILTLLNKDSSIYVRKAVGNNIKDLSKYMPQVMLNLMESWISNSNIEVRDDLASETGLNTEEKRLIWTIKHGMRWIREKNPELRNQLEKILGKNYVLYFDEKKNKYAKPTENI